MLRASRRACLHIPARYQISGVSGRNVIDPGVKRSDRGQVRRIVFENLGQNGRTGHPVAQRGKVRRYRALLAILRY